MERCGACFRQVGHEEDCVNNPRLDGVIKLNLTVEEAETLKWFLLEYDNVHNTRKNFILDSVEVKIKELLIKYHGEEQ